MVDRCRQQQATACTRMAGVVPSRQQITGTGMPAYKLLLHPKDPDWHVETTTLADSLHGLGLIGAPVQLAQETFYPVGEQFLQLVTFLGCSPAIELDPPDDPALLEAASASGSFCHVLLGNTAKAWFRGDDNTPAPPCPHCRTPLADWPALRSAWRDISAQARWTCTTCGQSGEPAGLVFRKTAGVARSWVEIRGIYPSEAIPGSALLDCLRNLSGCDWKTIYLQE
jgi:hypothetical protein